MKNIKEQIEIVLHNTNLTINNYEAENESLKKQLKNLLSIKSNIESSIFSYKSTIKVNNYQIRYSKNKALRLQNELNKL